MESRKNTVFPGIFIPINETLRSKLQGMKPSFGLKQLCPDNDTQTVTADKTATIPPQRRTRAPTGNSLSEQGSAGEFWVCRRGEAGSATTSALAHSIKQQYDEFKVPVYPAQGE